MLLDLKKFWMDVGQVLCAIKYQKSALITIKKLTILTLGKYLSYLHWVGILPCLYVSFTKRNNFHDILFASLDNAAVP